MARDDLFMLTLAEAVVRAAILRRESRGAHWRTDYPDKSDALGNVNFIVCKTDAGMEVQPLPIPPMPAELADLI
jgi:succinate dehydrogenase / fumarate reductase flavoprotein subunit